MTPEERAIQLLNSSDWAWADANSKTCEPLVPVIAEAIREAILEEREACARVAEKFILNFDSPKQVITDLVVDGISLKGRIAQAIRERGK